MNFSCAPCASRWCLRSHTDFLTICLLQVINFLSDHLQDRSCWKEGESPQNRLKIICSRIVEVTWSQPSCASPLPFSRWNRLLQSSTAITPVPHFTHLGTQLVSLTVTLCNRHFYQIKSYPLFYCSTLFHCFGYNFLFTFFLNSKVWISEVFLTWISILANLRWEPFPIIPFLRGESDEK